MFLDGSVRSTRRSSFSGRAASTRGSDEMTSSVWASRSNSAGFTEIG